MGPTNNNSSWNHPEIVTCSSIYGTVREAPLSDASIRMEDRQVNNKILLQYIFRHLLTSASYLLTSYSST